MGQKVIYGITNFTNTKANKNKSQKKEKSDFFELGAGDSVLAFKNAYAEF